MRRESLTGDRVRAVLLVVAICATAILFSSSLWAPRFELKLQPSAIAPELGLAYTAPVQIEIAFPFHVPFDSMGGAASNLALKENGRLLGPPHSQHADIRSQGGGRFSHWNDTLYFSTSDGSDPRVNGRSYTAEVSTRLSLSVWIAVLLAEAGIILALRRWLFALLVRQRKVIAGAVLVAACAAAAMLAAGIFGVINPTGSPPKPPSLVLNIAAHVVLGCVLTLAQWCMGAGVARALLPTTETSYAQIMLLGFPLSLALMALLTAIALLLPYGAIVALLLWACTLLPLLRWPLERAHLQSLLRALPSLLVLSFAFGCWMTLLWHGPTARIPGAPAGDQIFYSSAVSALSAHPVGWPNLANEGEMYPYSNLLFPALGAVLVRIFPLDGFLFICSATAVSVLGTGLAIHAYLTERPPVRIATFEALTLMLALVAAGRTPSWIIFSPQVAFVAPLAIAVWFWTVRGRQSSAAASIAVASSIAGSALSKVMSAGTLTPLALAGLLPHLRRMPRGLQVILAFLAAASAGYITYMLAQFLPLFIRLTTVEIGLGPRSLNAVFRWGYSFYAAWPYVAQDLGILLMIVAAFRLMGVLKAAAIACGLVLVLAYSFLTMINFICAVLILALAAIDDAASLRHSRWLVLAAFILVLPPMLLTDEAGLSTGLVWSAIMAAVALVTIQAVQPAADQARAVRRPQTLATSTVLAVALLLLVASARGTLVLSSGWPGGTDLSPRVRDIWQAVRERVPADALIFTDQTGRDNGFLGGWNTYVLNGQRQVYIASWYQSIQLRPDPAARDARLQVNDEVLSGQLDPAQVKTSRQYGSFFAVVSAQRRPLPRWQPVYANQDYALYRWNP